MNFWTAEPIWAGETCFIIGGGTSLAGFDFEILRGKRVIAINSSVFSVPFADVCFYGDDRWGFENGPRLRSFKGLVVTTSATAATPDTKHMKKIVPPPALMERRDALVMRRTSTQAAINLAMHFGVAQIVLLGIDMKAGDNGRTHHHAPHPWPSVQGCWDVQMGELAKTAPLLAEKGIAVRVAGKDSRIGWWPKAEIGELL
ncbi:MAG: hypothetical protein ABFD96_25445 [Armatimonadia bacterium]